MIKNVIEFIFGSALFINALIFIPQAIRIFKGKTAKGVSLLTFIGFLLIQLTIVLHGIINQDYLLVSGYLLSMLTCGLVVFLALTYKRKDQLCNHIDFEKILEQLPGHIYWKDKDGVLLGCNKKNWIDFGMKSLSDFIGKTDYDLFPKHEADQLRMADEEVMHSGSLKIFEEESTIYNGEKALYLSHKAPLRDEHNQIIGVLGASVDITTSKRETLEKLKTLENIIAIMPGHVYWLNTEGAYLGCNDNQAKSIGFVSRQEIIGKRNTEIRGFFIPEVLDPVNKEVMRTGKTVITEEPATLNDGTEAIFLSTKTPLYNYKCEITGMVGISIDITDRKKAEHLKLETELQEVKLQEQENFAAVASQVSHDIRSPLASLEMILASCKDIPETKRIALRSATKSVTAIADNLLCRYRKYESEKDAEAQEPRPILVSLALEEVLSLKKSQYNNSLVKFNSSFEPNSNFVFIKADPSNFNRMISNLINNAVDAFEGKGGEVDLTLNLDNEKVDIIIQDNGKGMPQKIIDKIMNNIAVTVGKKDGNGIGLAQVRNTLHISKGKMSIESEIGMGTKIMLTFPRVGSPDWITKEIVLHKGDTVIILDDDNSIHTAWDARFEDYAGVIHLEHFMDGEEASDFISSAAEKNKIFLLSDFELINQEFNGLQIIEKTSMQTQSILVTSHYHNQPVLDLAAEIGVKVLPKQLAPEVPINVISGLDPDDSKKRLP